MVLDGTGSVYDDTRWYMVSISWYCLVLGGSAKVQQWASLPVYIEKMEIWSCVTDPSNTHTQTTEYSATQLVSSIKLKLSHANGSRPGYMFSIPT